ncbi:double-stranded RNA-binding protein 1-like isoform X2 [Coffea eugenioides]|uniref:double-stranded RNA-binding protein 1-like isoform X2 n=1 Tax=Coffea eugenioides TaxID=49369 RepID=UPI000F615A87|nr:double-stranded RNA-binding protein 1-like isoform X2 [Coffea eugenioides]
MFKSKLQELCHQHAWELPVYTTVKDGPDHCPRFTTTVTVAGMSFESPLNQCKSSKDSQNVAAKLAYDHFSASPISVTSPPPPPPLSLSLSPGFAASSSIVDVRHAKNDNLHQKVGGNVAMSPVNETPLAHKDESRAKDLLHVYKSRLQHYAQKKSLALPEYSLEFDGPPHARLFRASVTIDGRTYRTLECYPTLKDAEHAAAKVALESLSLGEIQEDEGLYKTLLQELAQKEGFYFPSYCTVKTGPSHMPTFVSTVEVGGETYQGRECKTKKQSEMSAAKVAYNSLMERTTVNNLPLGCSTKDILEVPSLSLEPAINDKCQPNIGAETTEEYHMGVAVGKMDGKSSVVTSGSERKEYSELFDSSVDSVVGNDLQQNIQPKPIPTVKENLDAAVKGEETNAKRYRCSPTENMHESRPEISYPSSASLNTPSSCSMPSVSAESDAAKPAGGNTRRTKILVFPRGSPMEIPEGASILPYSDDKWVAVKVELNQNQQS